MAEEVSFATDMMTDLLSSSFTTLGFARLGGICFESLSDGRGTEEEEEDSGIDHIGTAEEEEG